ncbi:MAG TPA: aminopeptidase [Gaiellaceae bacterium]|nr:aminopeptidase [Gaiellaceae bacterium]
MTPEERLERYARLAVEVGLDLRPGQTLWLQAMPEHRPLAREIARIAYERGARYVDVEYHDQHVRHARIANAPEESLDWTPPWSLAKIDHIAETHGALLQITGDPHPELMADLDGARVGRTRPKLLSERYVETMNKRLMNWSILAYPNDGWARSIFGEPDVERLWEAVATATRLDEPDPVAAWRARRASRCARGC